MHVQNFIKIFVDFCKNNDLKCFQIKGIFKLECKLLYLTTG